MQIIRGTLAEEILMATRTGLIDSSCESNEEMRPKLLVNDYRKGNTVLANIEKELNNCESFIFSVAFITKSGLIVLKNTLNDLREKGIQGQILTTDYLAFNEPNALRELIGFENIEVRVFTKEHFHTKGYLFFEKGKYTFVVGSSNLTQSALKANKEWNLKVTSLENGELIQDTLNDFKEMWEEAQPLTMDWISEEYEPIWKEKQRADKLQKVVRIKTHTLKPNKMQIAAIQNLERLRKEKQSKALLISATGTGKTYLAAFDVRNYIRYSDKHVKVLFLVHRKRILQQAEESFKDVMGESISTGILTGDSVCNILEVDFLFSTTSMMSKEHIYQQFNENYFDYIIVDEAHRAGADGYLKFLEYFKPRFLFGMTATPERPDGFDVYSLFNHNIAYEVRLEMAMKEKLLCPFHYFGVSEIELDGKIIDDSDFEKIFSYLVSDERVRHIIEKINFYGHSGDRVKGLVFCRNISEADELSRIFNENEFKTVSINSKNDTNIEESIERLEQEEYESGLDYIFTVDMFNEGIDIPEVNQIVMLRPTQSSIVFIQQLGRGLRKASNKEYVVIIDFIGNYQNNFLIPMALSGDRTGNKDTIRKYVAEGNRVIPGCSTVNFDAIAKERIYKSINFATLNKVSDIKYEYKCLRNKLGRIPTYSDFEEYNTIDIKCVFNNNSLGSYHNFLKKYEPEYKYKNALNTTEEEMLIFVSQKIANGKRLDELLLLKRIIKYKSFARKLFDGELENKYGIAPSNSRIRNIYKVLTNDFVPSEPQKKKFAKSIFVRLVDGEIEVSEQFENLIENTTFYELLNDLIEYGISRHMKYYSNKYKNTDFTLYQKYTKEDAFRLLNWEKSYPSLNIGGYFFDKETHTLPVFITYKKNEDVVDSQNYKDRFVSPAELISISKPGRNLNSPEMNYFYAENTLIYLFMQKNSNDKGSGEYYFMGQIYNTGDKKEVARTNVGDTVLEFRYKLDVPVREDLYQYFSYDSVPLEDE